MCPEAAAEALEKGTDEWNAADLPMDGTAAADLPDVMNLWGLVFHEVGYDPTDGDILRFRLWMAKPVDAAREPEGGDEVDVSDKDGKDEKDEKEGDSGEKRKTKGRTLSAAARQDMEIQGMRDEAQVGYLNAAIYLGYHPSRAECAGLGHGDLATSSEVIRKMAKLPGGSTVHDALSRAHATRSSAPLATHFMRLADSLSDATDDHANYATVASASVAKFFNRVRDSCMDDYAVVLYIEDVLLSSCRGRGLPFREPNGDLLRRVEKRSAEMRDGVGAAAPGSKATPSESKSEMAALSAQISELMSASEAMESRLNLKLTQAAARTDTKFQVLTSKVGDLEAKVGKPPSQTVCKNCGQKGHKAADCANPKA